MARKTDNLIRFDQMSKERHRELSSRGGKATAKARKQRLTLKEELLALLSDKDTQKNMSISVLAKALDGDIRAFEVIRDTIGEKPTDKVDMNANVSYESKIKEVVDTDEY